MNRTELYKATGNSLPELLLAMAIVSIVATGVVLTFSHLSTATFTLKTFKEHAYGTSSTLALLQQGMIHLDAHTLPFPPRIHRQTIKFYPPALGSLAIENRDDTSHAVTFFEVVPHTNLLIRRWFSSQSIEACNNPTFSWQMIRSAIAISHDSFAEIAINETTPTSQNCRVINFTTPDSSMIAPQKMRTLPYKIIPLKRTYTLYRATSGALRYLSHVGPDIIENQPLTHRSPALHLQLKSHEAENIYEIQIQYETLRRNSSKTIHILTHVPRLSLSNNALNGF